MTTLCFIHIPKTAGSAIRFASQEALGDRLYWYGLPGMPLWQDVTTETAEKYELIAGHLTRSEFDTKLPSDHIYLTLVRSPVQRVVSLFQYITEGWDANQPWREELKAKGLAWALDHHEGFRSQALNEQCWFLSGKRTFEGALESLQKGKWIVGTIEEANGVWNEACTLMGWPRMWLAKANVSRKGYYRVHATPAVVEAIQAHNAEDQRLYDHIARITGPVRWRRRLATWF